MPPALSPSSGLPASPPARAAARPGGAPPRAATDYDSLQTGFRREATYYQLHSFVEHITTSLAPAFLAGLLLLGDTAANPLGVRLVGPAAGLLVLAGYLVFRRYDLPDEVLAPLPSTSLR